MKASRREPLAAEGEKKAFTVMYRKTLSRRELLAGSAALGATVVLRGEPAAAADAKRTFTILHTNDLHSNLIGMGPASDYTPFSLNDDATRGGFARLATLIARRKETRAGQGPVLVLDAGDYSMGTAFAGATRETGAELQLLSRMGCDATTFGNHDFDLGPDGTASSIAAAAKAGHVPVLVASNTDFSANDAKLVGLRRLAKGKLVRHYVVIERGGIRFGIFGLLGKEAQLYTDGAGAVTFGEPIEAAQKMVELLREKEKADVIIALSHGGMEKGKDGRFTDGEDVRIAKAVPGIDVVIGAHSHTDPHEPVDRQWSHARSPNREIRRKPWRPGDHPGWQQADGQSYKLYPIDDTIIGDQAIADEIDKFKKTVTEVVFKSRGYRIDQALAVAPRDIPNAYTDIAASTLLANFCTDAFRQSHESGHRLYRQWNDARRFHSREVRCANGLRRVFCGTSRRRCGGTHRRQHARDGLFHRPGSEKSS